MKYNTVHAIIESPRMQSHFTTEGLVFGTCTPDHQIMYDNVVIRSGWAAVSSVADELDGE